MCQVSFHKPLMLCLKPVGRLKLLRTVSQWIIHYVVIWLYGTKTSVLYFYPVDLPAECKFNFVFSISILPTPDHLSVLQTSGEAWALFAVQLTTTIYLRNSWQSILFCHLPCFACNVRALSVLEEWCAWGEEQSPTDETFKCHKMSLHQINFKILKKD